MSKLYDKADIAIMSPITQKLDALLKAEGFTALETERAIGGHDQAVNRLAYMNGKNERVYIFTHELLEGKTA